LHRYCKHDEQLCKKIEQLTESAADYFKWAAASPPHDDTAGSTGSAAASCSSSTAALTAFLRFVDGVACYFSPVGVPGKITSCVVRVAKGCATEARESAAAAVDWQAGSLRGSAKLWRDMKPALRTALESASADAAEGAEGGERRKRTRQ
jgi:hypothetical protein